jgi:hypothetical protein
MGLITAVGWAVIGLVVAAIDQAMWPDRPDQHDASVVASSARQLGTLNS